MHTTHVDVSTGGMYEAVGQKRPLDDLAAWGPSPKLPAPNAAMFQALHSLVRAYTSKDTRSNTLFHLLTHTLCTQWPPKETNSGHVDPGLLFQLQQHVHETPSVHAPLQQGGAFSDELAALLSHFEQPGGGGNNALEQQKQRLAEVLGLAKPLPENGSAEQASSGRCVDDVKCSCRHTIVQCGSASDAQCRPKLE